MLSKYKLDKGRLKHYVFKLSVSIAYFDALNFGISSDKSQYFCALPSLQQDLHVPFTLYQEYQYKVYRLHIGEGKGTSFQYSCLENPIDGGAW